MRKTGLVLYQALRSVMVTAVETRPGTDPDRAGFTIALEAARDSVITAAGVTPTPVAGKVDLAGHIGKAVLAGLLPARRLRFSVHTVKCGISRYHTWNADNRPPTSTTITAIDVSAHQPDPPKPRRTTRPARQTPPRQRPHPQPGPDPTDTPTRPPDRRTAVLATMRSAPDHTWRARDIARTLGITGEKGLNSFCVQMSTWAHRGLFTKTAPATYTIT